MKTLTSSSPLPFGFDDDQLRQLTAGLSEQQLLWLSGYLYGRTAAAGAPVPLPAEAAPQPAPQAAPAPPAPAVADAPRLTILYGSQTGNSKKVAGWVADAARQRGLAPAVRDLNDYAPKDLKTEQLMLLVVSTHGEGDPPVAAEELHQFLLSARAPKLPGLRYAVLALGDRSYLQFCQTGFEFDQRLAELGAQRLLDRLDCDVDFEPAARRWAEQVTELLAETAPAPPVGAAPAAVAHGAVSVATGVRSQGFVLQPAPVGALAGVAEVLNPAAAPTEPSRHAPLRAPLLEKIQLNGRGSAKETYHLEFSVEGSGLRYQPGDALLVQPTNRPALVEEVLHVGHFAADASVQLHGAEVDLVTALTEHLELTTLTRDVLERYAALAPQHPQLRALLADRAQLPAYLRGRDVVDLLREFPAELPAQHLAAVLRPLPARAYSIASSPAAHAGEVHLLVAAVRYQAHGRPKHGAASGYLADQLAPGDAARVWVDRNEYFKLPADPTTDILMVGPGTGVAPFRGFLAERAETGATGRNWLVFGNPHFTTDFLYQTEWQQHLKRGTLHRLDVAFSRDQAEKRYVQHALQAQSRRVYEHLENGGHFYVCGDKTRMAADVQQALLTIIAQESGRGADQAAEYLKQLKKQRRYLEDVY